MKEEILKSLGLSDKEVKIYLANLQVGSNLVQNIANFANMNRTSAYDLLKSLEQKGFVSYTIKSGKKYYQAVDPKKIIDLLKEKELMIKKILPELNSLKQSYVDKPNIEVYTGKEGLKTIFENILNESKEYYCMASKNQLIKLFKFYMPHFVQRRINKKIKVKLITETIPIDKKAPFKLINKNIKTATWLYHGKIAMISLEEKEPIGILINEKNFYQTHKMMFELLWENL
jgi:HTH-type transcriptional regulator, sugar sensing transcriptional regulator